MPQSLGQIYVHVVYSTRSCDPFLAEGRVRRRMHAYLGGVCKHLKCIPLAIGGIEDHVHVLCKLHRTITVADLVRIQKRESSAWIKTIDAGVPEFYWQKGYGVFSVTHSGVDEVSRYIQRQEQIHKTRSFKEEYVRMLQAHGVAYDPDYLWD